jgi:hypothetical protein
MGVVGEADIFTEEKACNKTLHRVPDLDRFLGTA